MTKKYKICGIEAFRSIDNTKNIGHVIVFYEVLKIVHFNIEC